MELFLVRHAIAADGSPDGARPLTPEGRQRFQQEVRGLQELGITLERVCSSPLVRAVETAELLAPLGGGPVQQTDLLANPPGDDLDRFVLESGAASLAAVGHEPWMSSWLARLLEPSGRLAYQVPFKKGAVAWLEGEVAGQMRLVAFLPPRVLRGLGA